MNKTKRYALTAVLLCSCSGAAVTSVQAKMNIEPVIVTGYRYNSNFWRSEDNEVAVGSIEIKPGVKANYETGKTQIDLDAFLEGYIYNDYDTPPEGVNDADDDNYVGAFIDLMAANQTTDRINLGVDETFSYTRDPAASDDFYNSIAREKYLINRFSPNAYYDFGNKFGVALRYINLYTDYQEGGEDSIQHQGLFDLDYYFKPTSRLFLTYDIWTRDYDRSSATYLSNRVKLNYEHQFNFFTVSAGAGYHNRNFDNDVYEDLDLFSWNISVLGQNPPAPDENPKSYMNLTISQDMNDAGAGNSYYTATKAEAEFGYIFLERIVTGLEGYIQQSDYELYLGENADRDDTTYAVSGSVGYKFWRRGEVNFELGYKDRDSNLEGRSYKDTYGLVTLEFGLDLGVL